MNTDERTRSDLEIAKMKEQAKIRDADVAKLKSDVNLYLKVIPAVFAAIAAVSAYWGFAFIPKKFVEQVTLEQIEQVKADMAKISRFAADLQRTDGASGCTKINEMQMCWGSIEVRAGERHAQNPDVISGVAKYARAFRSQPNITTGIRTQTTDDSGGNGCSWSIYNAVPGAEVFNVAAILVSRPPDPVQCRQSRVAISYFAVGAPAP